MVVQLLVFRRGVSHQGTSGDAKVGTCVVQGCIDQKIFLFPSQVGIYSFYVGCKHFTNRCGGFVYGCKGLQEGSLVVECFACIRDEDGWDTKGLVYNECRRRYVPCGVSSCFEGVTDTSVWEARCIGFLLDEELARKAFDYISVFVEFNETVVLLGGAISQRLKPVSVMGYIECFGPTLHAVGNHVGHFAVERNTLFDSIYNGFVGFARKEFLHFLTVEDVSSVVF